MGWKKRAALSPLLILFVLITQADTLHLGAVERLALPHRFSLASWVTRNLPDRTLYRLRRFVPGQGLSQTEELRRIQEYFQLGAEASGLRRDLAALTARGDSATGPETRLESIRDQRLRLRDAVEHRLERELATTLVAQGLRRDVGPFSPLFPPVDFRLDRLPRVLAVSPRDLIGLQETHLLDGLISPEESEELEARLLQDRNLSALVTGLGGLASYPALVSTSHSLRAVLRLSAHEWLHQYWFFQPLGQAYWDSADLTTLNETAASIAGRELGDLVFDGLDLRTPPRTGAEAPSPDFDFNAEMRETRLRAEELLTQGLIEEAEAYMEDRRDRFVENGYSIRKLNQAYFAFHGTYAESPTSTSPIAGQLQELRRRSPDIGAFVRSVARFGTYQEFLKHLEGDGQAG